MTKTLLDLLSKRARPQEKIFLQREYSQIVGKKSTVLLLLAAVVFLSFAAMSLAKSGMDYAKSRMDNVFVSVVNVAMSNANYSARYDSIAHYVHNVGEAKRFGVENSGGYYRSIWDFYKTSDHRTTGAFVQSFNFSNDLPLIDALLSDENLIHSFLPEAQAMPNSSDLKDGIFVTESYLKELQIDIADLENGKIMATNRGNIQFRVLGVVKSMPNYSDVLCEESLFLGVRDDDANILPYKEIDAIEIYLFDANYSQDKLDYLREKIEKSSLRQKLDLRTWKIVANSDVPSHAGLLKFPAIERFSTQDAVRFVELLNDDSIIAEWFKPANKLSHSFPQILYTEKKTLISERAHYDFLSIQFANLDSIQQFKDEFAAAQSVKLDLEKINALDNFGLVISLCRFLVVCLVLFTLLFVIVLIFNVIRNHLEKIKMNLGTFMAFGISNDFIIAKYRTIIFAMISTAIIFALLPLVVLQGFFSLQKDGDSFLDLFYIFNPWVLFSIVLIYATVFLVFNNLLSKTLKKCPGDLIYDRK